MQNTGLIGLPASPFADGLNRAGDQLKSRIHAAESATGEARNAELKKAAHEFEALFVSYLLKVMRETIEESGLTDGGFGKTIYTELFDEEMSRTVAQQSPLGLSNLILNGLSAEGQADVDGSGKKVDPFGQEPAKGKQEPAPGPLSNPVSGTDIPDSLLPIQAPVSSAFGIRRDPFTHTMQFHKGIDLAAPAGTSVRAAISGTVVFSGTERGYGNTVVIRHGDQLETRYAHLGRTDVKAGDVVREEDIIGSVGSTGRSTGPHLHFEVTRLGEAVDPVAALAD
jgi:murein DD-endopeptidase MepM/ murein hydrolase activator NlpD